MDYLIVLETTNTGFSANAPYLPGCIATGKTLDEVRARMREAVEFHIEGLRLEGFPFLRHVLKQFSSIFLVSGSVKGERRVEVLYDIKTFAAKAGITASTARVYAHRYGIGRKLGRGWVFTDADLKAISKASKTNVD